MGYGYEAGVRDQLGRADGRSFGLFGDRALIGRSFLSPTYHWLATRDACGRTGVNHILWTIGPDTNDVRASQWPNLLRSKHAYGCVPGLSSADAHPSTQL